MRDATEESFTVWAAEVEPRLRRGLTATFGPDLGREAAERALAEAWIHWDRVEAADDRMSYVYGIGRNLGRRALRGNRQGLLPAVPPHLPHVEPGLPKALAELGERQRTVVTLLYGYEWTMAEVAELLGIAKTSVQNHAERGLAHLRSKMGVEV